MEKESLIPEFNYKPDIILMKISLVLFFTPLMYGVFVSYLPPFMKYVWIAVSPLLATALFLLGRFSARVVAKERVPYDPEKSYRSYIKLTKSWLAFLVSLAVGAVFFFLALGIKEWYLSDFHDGTTAHAVGYVYEAICAGYAFLVTFISAIIWFIHDELVLPASNYLSFALTAPIAMIIVPPVFAGVPAKITAVYAGAMIIVVLIRYLRIRAYTKMVDKIERDMKFYNHTSKYDK